MERIRISGVVQERASASSRSTMAERLSPAREAAASTRRTTWSVRTREYTLLSKKKDLLCPGEPPVPVLRLLYPVL